MQINILGQKYEVVEVDFMDEQEETKIVSDIDCCSNKIIILENLSKERKEHCLWYEIIEGILIAQGHAQYTKDERLIEALATGIHNVLKDNDIFK